MYLMYLMYYVDGVTADYGDASGRRSGPRSTRTRVFYSCIQLILLILFTLFIHGTLYSIQSLLDRLPRETINTRANLWRQKPRPHPIATAKN